MDAPTFAPTDVLRAQECAICMAPGWPTVLLCIISEYVDVQYAYRMWETLGSLYPATQDMLSMFSHIAVPACVFNCVANIPAYYGKYVYSGTIKNISYNVRIEPSEDAELMSIWVNSIVNVYLARGKIWDWMVGGKNAYIYNCISHA